METLNTAVKTAIADAHSSKEGLKQYRILNTDGLIYSQHLGWVELNGDVYGHMFDEKEVPVVISILKEHGYTDVQTELDKAGTLFAVVAESPFGNPSKMVHLLIYTGIFFALLYLIVLVSA